MVTFRQTPGNGNDVKQILLRRCIPKEVAHGYSSVTKGYQVAPSQLSSCLVNYTLGYGLEALNLRAGHTRDILPLISVFMITCATSCGKRLFTTSL